MSNCFDTAIKALECDNCGTIIRAGDRYVWYDVYSQTSGRYGEDWCMDCVNVKQGGLADVQSA